MEKGRIKFDVEADGAKREFYVVKPTSQLRARAQMHKAAKIREAAQGGALLREEVVKLLRDRKVWDDEKEELYLKLAQALKSDEVLLAEAKKRRARKSEGRDIALRMAANFSALQTLQAERSSLDHLTAEGMSVNAEFDYLLSHCTKTAEGNDYYASYDEMVAKAECPVFETAKEKFQELLFGRYEEELKKRPEMKFLIETKCVDEKLNLIDKDGHRIDGLGRRVDDKGRLINGAGELVDGEGRRVDENGFLVMDEGGWSEDEEPAKGEVNVEVKTVEDAAAVLTLANEPTPAPSPADGATPQPDGAKPGDIS
jgi:hypothetical protein